MYALYPSVSKRLRGGKVSRFEVGMSFIYQTLDAIATTCNVMLVLCCVSIVAVVAVGAVLYSYLTDDRLA